MQLVQELHKALFLGKQKRRRLDGSRNLGIKCGSERWLPYWLRAYRKGIPSTIELNPYNICFPFYRRINQGSERCGWYKVTQQIKSKLEIGELDRVSPA